MQCPSKTTRSVVLAVVVTASALLISACQSRVAPESKTAPLPDLEQRLALSLGSSFFNKPWVMAPSTTTARDGLGPLFNAHSCAACHPRLGRGQLSDNQLPHREGLLFRLATDSLDNQLQTRALPGFTPDPDVEIQYRYTQHHFADGETIELRTPVYIADEDLPLSPRLAPPLTGVGLIEKLGNQWFFDSADPEDRDRDGISGRIHWIDGRVGRFGWKAEVSSLKEQTAKAFNQDIGISSSVFPEEPLPAECFTQAGLCNAVSGGIPEISDKLLNAVVDYVANASTPKVTAPEQSVGRKLFEQAKCQACHQIQAIESGEQEYYPYSDFLLHDMGSALSDQTDSPLASEWRTAPLWRLGKDSGPYLHDGRARTLLEAILWHGGEGQKAANAVQGFDHRERLALVEFLKTL